MPSGLIMKPAPGSGGESSVASILVPGGGLSAPLLIAAGVPLAAAGVPLAEGCATALVCCLALFRASLAAWMGFGTWALRVHTNRAAKTVASAKVRNRALPDFQFMNVMEGFSACVCYGCCLRRVREWEGPADRHHPAKVGDGERVACRERKSVGSAKQYRRGLCAGTVLGRSIWLTA